MWVTELCFFSKSDNFNTKDDNFNTFLTFKSDNFNTFDDLYLYMSFFVLFLSYLNYNLMKIRNKDVIQSYILTTAKYDFTVYEKRILYRLVELAQKDLQGKRLDVGYRIDKTLFDDKIITMPIKSFLSSKEDTNYVQVKKALEKLNEKKIEYETAEKWQLIRLVEKPVIDKYNSTVQFEINPNIWLAILNFAKGYRKYELKTAMSFNSVYAMRFYELLSNVKTPIAYSIDELKRMFAIENKYKKINDFIKRVIEPAQEELTEKAPYSFDYITLKTGRKITAIKFIPIPLPENRDKELERKELQKQVSLRWDLPSDVIQYLKFRYGFTDKEIKRNLSVLKKANEEIDLLLFIAQKYPKTQNKRNPKGYLINAIKDEISY